MGQFSNQMMQVARKKLNFNWVLLSIIFYSIAVPCYAQNSVEMTLPDALKMALENNISIKIIRNEAELAAINNYAGGAGMLPTISAKANLDNSVNNSAQEFLNGTSNNVNAAKTKQLGGSIDMGYIVFDGFKMFATKEKLKEFEEMGQIQLKSKIEDLLQAVSAAYIDLELAQLNLTLNSKIIQLSKFRYDLANEKFKIGNGSKSDVLKAEVDWNMDSINGIKLQNELIQLQIGFSTLLGKPANFSFKMVPVIDSTIVNVDYQNIKQKILSANYNLQLAKKSEKINALNLNEIKAARMPSLAVRAGYSYNSQQSQAGFLQSSKVNGLYYGAGVNINLFNGFKLNHQIKYAQLSAANGKLNTNLIQQNIEANFEQLFQQYLVSKNMIVLQKKFIETATYNLKLSKDQLEVGLISALEYRNAQEAFLASTNSLNTAYGDAKKSVFLLLKLSGELSSLIK
jgi:outer membrane protein TolC